MNRTADDLLDIYYAALMDDIDDDVCHYGKKRRSGRYPWGSGKDPYQHGDNRDFLGRVEELKKKGWTETAENIKKEFGCSMNEYRYEKSISSNSVDVPSNPGKRRFCDGRVRTHKGSFSNK